MRASSCIFGIAIAALPLASADPYDYGYWNVSLYKSWSALGYRSWNLEANYSLAPAFTKHSYWQYRPENGSTEITHHDPNFRGVFSDNGSVKLSQSVELPGLKGAVDVTGTGTISCKMNLAGRGCDGTTRIDAACVGERCI